MKIRKAIASALLLSVVSVTAACGTGAATSSQSSRTSTSGSTTDTGSDRGTVPGGGGPGGGTDASSVSTEAELVALIQEAYGDGGLDLHRGHQPVQDVLDEVLSISHDELHVRMEEAGQNLAAVAEDISVDPQTLVDALVESWGAAIDDVLASGEITADEAEQYRAALTEAFEFRVAWDGKEATPTFAGLAG